MVDSFRTCQNTPGVVWQIDSFRFFIHSCADLYPPNSNSKLQVIILGFIRPEQNFDSLEALVDAIRYVAAPLVCAHGLELIIDKMCNNRVTLLFVSVVFQEGHRGGEEKGVRRKLG